MELLVPALETMASEATSLGLELNWQKTKVQALCSREDVPSTITVLVRRWQWLKSLSILSTQQLKALLISQVAMPLLVRLYRTQTNRSEVKNIHFNQAQAV